MRVPMGRIFGSAATTPLRACPPAAVLPSTEYAVASNDSSSGCGGAAGGAGGRASRGAQPHARNTSSASPTAVRTAAIFVMLRSLPRGDESKRDARAGRGPSDAAVAAGPLRDAAVSIRGRVHGRCAPRCLKKVQTRRQRLESPMDLRLFATVFASVFVAELGDKTQLATLLFASEAPGARLTVFLGASLALVATSAIGVLASGLVA